MAKGIIWEVIADDPREPKRPPFGLCFSSQHDARSYTRTLRRLGYNASISPPYGPETSVGAALQALADYWGGDGLQAAAADRLAAEEAAKTERANRRSCVTCGRFEGMAHALHCEADNGKPVSAEDCE